MRPWRVWVACAALLVGAAPAFSSTVGVSLGMIFPADSLSGADDYRGSEVFSGPSAGLHLQGVAVSRARGMVLDGSIEVARLSSPVNSDLRTLFVPVQLGPSWKLGDFERVSMGASLSAGAAFVSTNIGQERSLAQGIASLAWHVKRALPHASISLEMALSLLWGESAKRTLQLRLIMLSR